MFRAASLATLVMLNFSLVSPASADPVSFNAKDGVTIYGDLRQAAGPSRGIILLFHMAGSNRREYAPIAPALNRAGFATLAIDQRSGGDLWGEVNRTAANMKKTASYADVLPDMEAAISFGEAQHIGPLVIWGSSYSSALVFIAAARHPEVKALLAFSPSEYIEGYSIGREAGKLLVPVFITSAPDVGEISSAKALAKAIPADRAVQYIPKYGVHGSSTLRADENPRGASENWNHVMAFLDNAIPPQR